MARYINLERRFHDLTRAELESPEHLAAFNDHRLGPRMGWPELLQHVRVLLLAEAGSGKTAEMQEQARLLVDEGRFAFFVALESLDREPLADLLSGKDEARLKTWIEDDSAPAWFFLDAVDELKLTEGKLDRALRRFAKSIDGCLDRARVVISCRPYDWRPDMDLATLENLLPAPPRRPNPAPPPDELFLQTLRKERGEAASREADPELAPDNRTVRTVILLPLSARQVERFAESSGVHDASALLAEIDRQNAWTFARRPLDLTELVATWTSAGRLGTRAEQHEANISAKLKDDPERPDRGILTDAQARHGAERLALALALTRTRTIRSPEQALHADRAEGVLDPAAVLHDWTEDGRQALLRRALFDPATYGRVRFHHRSVQEFLAAKRLKALRDKGMPIKALLRLVFAERYGVEVVIPSMRALAAWLAQDDDAVRRELTRREPEALLSLGDPESLDLSARASLLRAFADAYGEGGWRGLNIPIDEVRRIAHAELAPTIRELWGTEPANSDVRELLLELIWQGRIEGCADLAEAAAFNPEWDAYHRVTAVRALLACGWDEGVRRVADAMMTDPARWPDKMIHGLAVDLFPGVLSVAELLVLIERTPEPKRSTGGFGWALRQIAEALEPATDVAIALRDGLSDLIWRGRNAEQEFYRISGRFDHLAPALAILCARQITLSPAAADNCLIRASVVASRFGDDESGAREAIGSLRGLVQGRPFLREKSFWAELAFMDEIIPSKDDWYRLYHAEHHSLVGGLTEADRAWLETALADTEQPDRRPVALHALVQLWRQRGRQPDELEELRDAASDSPALQSTLADRTKPPEPNRELERMERENHRRKAVQEGRERKRLEDWMQWRAELLADPAVAFEEDRRMVTISNLYKWLNTLDQSRHRYDVWNREALTSAFGAEVAQRAADAFQALWRANPPVLWSTKAPEDRNSTSYVSVYGLSGLSAEASSVGWATRLTSDEAKIAAAYATLELNGFAPFITDLATSHPIEVETVLGDEISAELAVGGEHSHLPTLQDLSHAGIVVKQLLAPRLAGTLRGLPETFSDKNGPWWAHHIDQVLRILADAASNDHRRSVASECEKRYAKEPTSPVALVWLRGLFRFDPERGTQALTSSLDAADKPATKERAVRSFAGLFGDRDTIVLEIADPAQRARVLGRLVRSAYAFVRREDDQVHEGVFSPDTRDNAETARNFLLSALLDTPGPEARQVILELAGEADFAHFPDRLRLLARQRAAMDAEFVAFTPAEVRNLDNRYEAPPHDRDGLFQTMMDRLDDLAHDLAHSDFTDRRTLRTISEETEMQRTLSWRIEAKANGAFVISREDEVADLKRTDIRLAAVRGDQKAVIEVKLADQRWSLKQLERALRNQLVGQYLRHERCKSGCLLLTYDGSKKYWMRGRDRLNFQEVVAHLSGHARELEAENQHAIRLAVFGLDLTDPVLAPAH